MSTYTYVISTETLNGKVNLDALQSEIQKSSIPVALKVINQVGDSLDIEFKSSLSTSEETTLDTVVGDHSGEALPNKEVEEIRILEEDPEKRTGGHYMGLGLKHEVPAGMGTSTTIYSYPIDIGMLDFEFIPDSNMEGDELCILVAPGTIIGALTSNVTAGDTVINVSSTVTANTKIGYKIELDDATNSDDLGIVVGIDSENGTITMEKPAVNNYSVASPTYVRQSVYLVKDMRLNGTVSIALGSAKIGASFLPANTPWSIEYHNHEGSEKVFCGVLEILY